MNNIKIPELFDKPKIIALVGDPHEAKSMTLYHIIKQLRAEFNFNLVTFGLRKRLENSVDIFTTGELEQVRNSIVVIDEFENLIDLDNRKAKKQVERTLRLINHPDHNNIIILSGLPNNFKKFISAKIDVVIMKFITKADLINGSKIADLVKSFSGYQNGSTVLNIAKNQALVYNGKHFGMVDIPYYKEYDTKSKNVQILSQKMCKKGENK